MEREPMTTNIIMIARDRPRLTYQAIDSLYRNTPDGTFNLTVVDDGSDCPVAHSDDWHNCSIVRVDPPDGVVGRVRNLGIQWSEAHFGRGDTLCCLDNDTFMTPGWLETMQRALTVGRFHKYELLGGGNHPFHQVTSDLSIGNGLSIHEHTAVAGYSHFMTWWAYERFGPYDANAKGVRQSEDHAFCQRIREHGGRVGSIWPEVVYATGLTDTFGQPCPGADKMLRYEGVLQI
jgi:hypothetical protein